MWQELELCLVASEEECWKNIYNYNTVLNLPRDIVLCTLTKVYVCSYKYFVFVINASIQIVCCIISSFILTSDNYVK